MTVSIRDAVAKDAEAACDVLRRSIVELCVLDHRNNPAILERWVANKTPERFKAWLAQPGNSVLVAVEADVILAVGAVTDQGEITLNYVSPDARFRGISRALLRALEARARDRGNTRCTLHSTETALRFYRSAGYRDDGPATGHTGSTSGYPMSKHLHIDWEERTMGPFNDIGVERDGFVATIEIRRPPNNFFDISLINQIADALDALDADSGCRAVVLAAQGKAFCAGANFGDGQQLSREGLRPGEKDTIATAGHLYIQAVRLFRAKKPIVGAIHGAAVGGGLGLALVPDFRVTCPEARFSANFTRLGFHPGFGLTTTLPELIGQSKAAMMFYTSRRVPGDEAVKIGLADVLVPQAEVRAAAQKLAAEIAENSPLGVVATRATLRRGLADRVLEATERELVEQTRLRATEDFKEGVKAVAERRVPNFQGR